MGVHSWSCCHFLQCRYKTTLRATSNKQTKKQLKICWIVDGTRVHVLVFFLVQEKNVGVISPAWDNHSFLLLEKNVCMYVLFFSSTF